MDNSKIIVLCRGHTYLPAREVAKEYGQDVKTVYRILKEIEGQRRYEGYWLYLNEDGCRLVNTLIYEDYLHYRGQLKLKNIARHLPPFNPAEVRKQRGEYRQAVSL